MVQVSTQSPSLTSALLLYLFERSQKVILMLISLNTSPQRQMLRLSLLNRLDTTPFSQLCDNVELIIVQIVLMHWIIGQHLFC